MYNAPAALRRDIQSVPQSVSPNLLHHSEALRNAVRVQSKQIRVAVR